MPMTPLEYRNCVMELISPLRDVETIPVNVTNTTAFIQMTRLLDEIKRTLFYAKKREKARVQKEYYRATAVENTS